MPRETSITRCFRSLHEALDRRPAFASDRRVDSREFGIEALAVRDIGLRDADDVQIFQSARSADAVVMTKDKDFLVLLRRFGPPPKVIWLTCGNTSNERLKKILGRRLRDAMQLIDSGEPLVALNSPN
ncbi:MAG: DUF5615 family PIN-like protein [Pyrinomonadaceae bacterium]